MIVSPIYSNILFEFYSREDMIETDVYQYVKLHLEDLINIIDVDVLKILNFVPLPEDQPLPVALVLKASDHLTKALFIALQENNTVTQVEIIDHLHILSNSTTGLPMVMRSLLIGMVSNKMSLTTNFVHEQI